MIGLSNSLRGEYVIDESLNHQNSEDERKKIEQHCISNEHRKNRSILR